MASSSTAHGRHMGMKGRLVFMQKTSLSRHFQIYQNKRITSIKYFVYRQTNPELRSWQGRRAAPSPSPSAAPGDGTNVARVIPCTIGSARSARGGDSAARVPTGFLTVQLRNSG
jgi:hypothetical protein